MEMWPDEKDPNGIPAGQRGAKLDHGKSPVWRGLLDYFPRACRAVADVSLFGATKYSWKGFEAVEDGVKRYADAGARHIVDESIEGPITKDSGLPHKAHKAWNAFAELELFLREQENNANSTSELGHITYTK
jgi:hypothetical protein